jgi:hypothetical protein
MSIPTAPASKALSQSLNVVGKTVRTYRFKFNSNWNLKPLKQVLTQFSSKDFKNLGNLTKAMNEQKNLLTEIKNLKKTAETAKQAKGTVDNIKKGLDGFFKKVPGKDIGSKGTAAGGNIGGLLLTGGLAAAVIHSTLVQNYINDVADKRSDLLDGDLTKVNGRALQALDRARIVNEKVDAANKQNVLENQRTRDRIYGVEQQLPKIRDNANNALYETREGRKIVEGKIAEAKKQSNDALYEVRENVKRFNGQISKINADITKYLGGAKDNFQQKVETTIASLQKSVEQARGDAKNANDKTISLGKVVSDIQAKLSEIAKIKIPTIDEIKKQIAPEIKKVEDKVGVLFDNGFTKIERLADGTVKTSTAIAQKSLQQQLDDKYNQSLRDIDKFWGNNLFQESEKFRKYADENQRIAQGDTKLLNERFDQTNRDIDAAFERQKNENITFTNALKKIEQDRYEVEKKPPTIPPEIPQELDKLTREVDNLKRDNLQLKPDIEKLKRDIGEQDKLNREGLEKIKDIIPMIAGIPAIVGRDITNLRNTIPTPGDITAATGAAICNSANGGCLGNALNNQINNIKKNTNDALGKANLGANAAELALLGVIDAKLGDQLPGGIGGKLSRVGEWLHLDRVLNIMIVGTTVHNALMLSNDLGQTLLGIINNVLQLFGLKKEDGSAFDIGSVISGSIENLIKGVIGADNYTQLRETWAKANRIYQATTNVLNSFLNLSQTILQASELIAAHTGKIGNALKKGGIILENAYGWMNPQPKFNRVTQTLERLQNGASTIQMVTQAPLDVINAVTESTTAATEFVKAVKEDDKAENKATPIPEPDELKTKESQSKTDSQPLNFDFSDLFDGED